MAEFPIERGLAWAMRVGIFDVPRKSQGLTALACAVGPCHQSHPLLVALLLTDAYV